MVVSGSGVTAELREPEDLCECLKRPRRGHLGWRTHLLALLANDDCVIDPVLDQARFREAQHAEVLRVPVVTFSRREAGDVGIRAAAGIEFERKREFNRREDFVVALPQEQWTLRIGLEVVEGVEDVVAEGFDEGFVNLLGRCPRLGMLVGVADRGQPVATREEGQQLRGEVVLWRREFGPL